MQAFYILIYTKFVDLRRGKHRYVYGYLVVVTQNKGRRIWARVKYL